MNEAYVTYHPYTVDTSTNAIACSNGLNGLQTKYGLQDISTIFPMVTAFSDAPWNSPNCGDCYRLFSRYDDTTVDVTVIDFVPLINRTGSHFDLSKYAFEMLLGDKGIHDGSATVDWVKVGQGICDDSNTRIRRCE
jgi:hypothetical protein